MRYSLLLLAAIVSTTSARAITVEQCRAACKAGETKGHNFCYAAYMESEVEAKEHEGCIEGIKAMLEGCNAACNATK